MLPAPRTALSDSLVTLSRRALGDHELRLRVGLLDGTVLEGVLLSASPTHVSLRLPEAQARYVPVEDIASLHSAVRRSLRELIIVSGLILTVTAGIVALAAFPVARPFLARIAGGAALLGFAVIVQLQRRTRLGSWLTSWKTMFDARRP